VSQTSQYPLVILLIAVAGLLAVLASRLTERIKLPVPALMLVAAAVAVKLVPALQSPSERTVERLVTACLVCILFAGGMHIGWRKFRAAAVPITLVGLLGTFLTAVGGAALLHWVFGIDWYLALLVATAVAPTDPAVVFSVLGKKEVAGNSGTILEGESGANDPVGIALMAGLLAAGGLSASGFLHIGADFLLQMLVGAVVGAVGGRALLSFMRKVPLPSEALYPLRVLACVFILYGVATLAHGSGFLAVFVAGIVLGEARAPYKVETERFHAALASLAEIVAFVVLGLRVDLGEIVKPEVWIPGVVLGLALAFVIRPLMITPCLIPSALQRNERLFVLFAGLKGAVPILLGEMLRAAHVPDAERLYGIVVVVVVISVAVQGSLVESVAHFLRVPMRTTEPEPWSLGVRLRDEPEGVHRVTVQAGSAAEGRTPAELDELGEGAWISFIVRDSGLVRVSGDTRLRANDQLLILADPEDMPNLSDVFGPA
jgi:potassium/hydrogen antiporter